MMRHYLSILEETMTKQWNEPALSNFQGETFIHAEVAAEIAKLHIIFDRLGMKAGDKVALCGKNSARWAIAFLAVQTKRCVSVPILNEFTPEMMHNLAIHSESRILFTEKKMWSNLDGMNMPDILAVIDLSDFQPLYLKDESNAELFNNINTEFSKAYPNGFRPEMMKYASDDLDALAVINYSSGTTGSPKGIMLSARNISSNVEFGLSSVPCTPGKDTILSMLPMAHMYGLAFEFLYSFCGGCHVYFLGRTPSPSILLKAFAEVKPYLLIAVPLVIEKIFKNKIMPALDKKGVKILMQIPLLNKIVYSSIRKKLIGAFGGNIREIDIGGAALSKPVEHLMKKAGIPYTVGYGMTECAPLIGYITPSKTVLGACGKIVTNNEIRVDSEKPHKIVGELQVKGSNVMLGYYKNEEATKAAFTDDGWLRTGDLGIIDKNGYIFIKGRSKCMILTSNGQNIYPEEIEDILKDMPYVNECLVVERNKQLIAIVSPTKDKDHPLTEAKDLLPIMEQNRMQLNKLLPAYSKIQSIELIDGGFVHTPKHSIKRHLYN